jgi:hypothetical protein
MKQLTIREICIIPGHRGVQTKLYPVVDRVEAFSLGQRLASNRLCLVDLINDKGHILKRFSLWAV